MFLGLKHAALEVLDLKRALVFYKSVFGFQDYHVTDADWAMLYKADTTLSFVKVSQIDAQRSAAHHPAHVGFTFSSKKDVDEIADRLKAYDFVECSERVLHRDGSYGFYFSDTEGNRGLECIYIPFLGDQKKEILELCQKIQSGLTKT